MSSPFVEAITPYLDQDGLVGSCPNPTKWSSGNPLLETSIACAFEVLLNGKDADSVFLKARQDAILACKDPKGLFDKNPGRYDQITHDDLKPIASLSRLCGMPFAEMIVEFGKKNNWVLSNTGFPYWDAYAKPWDQAFYLIANKETPSWFSSPFLYSSIIFDGFKGDTSSNRLTWLAEISSKGVSPFLDFSFQIWARSMRKRYVTVGGMMFEYYGGKDPSRADFARLHPYVRFGRLIAF
jgi:hypothetical protein